MTTGTLNTAPSPLVFIPEFGIFNTDQLEQGKVYQGRLYRLSAEQVKQLAELSGFTARFDTQSVRLAYVDLFRTEGEAVLEIDRNTKPTDVSLRYMRDRWNVDEVASKGIDALRPWIRTEYSAPFIPEKVFALVAEQVRVKPEELVNFYLRVNLKDRVCGLICQETNVSQFPTGSFAAFSLPEDNIQTVGFAPESVMAGEEGTIEGEARPEGDAFFRESEAPKTQVAEPEVKDSLKGEAEESLDAKLERAQAILRERKERAQAPVEIQPKYATYSRSEVDQLLKQQFDAVISGLSGKISGQQRLLQEAIDKQAKVAAKLTDQFLAEFEQARVKLDQASKAQHEASSKQLDEFRTELSKELEHHRAQVNKNIIPMTKAVDEKIRQLEQISKQGGERVGPIIIKATIVVVAALLLANGLLFFELERFGDLSQIRSAVAELSQKVDKALVPGTLPGKESQGK